MTTDSKNEHTNPSIGRLPQPGTATSTFSNLGQRTPVIIRLIRLALIRSDLVGHIGFYHSTRHPHFPRHGISPDNDRSNRDTMLDHLVALGRSEVVLITEIGGTIGQLGGLVSAGGNAVVATIRQGEPGQRGNEGLMGCGQADDRTGKKQVSWRFYQRNTPDITKERALLGLLVRIAMRADHPGFARLEPCSVDRNSLRCQRCAKVSARRCRWC